MTDGLLEAPSRSITSQKVLDRIVPRHPHEKDGWFITPRVQWDTEETQCLLPNKIPYGTVVDWKTVVPKQAKPEGRYRDLLEFFNTLAMTDITASLTNFVEAMRALEDDPDFNLELDHIKSSATRAESIFQDALAKFGDLQTPFPLALPGLHSNFGVRFEWQGPSTRIRFVVPGAKQDPYIYRATRHKNEIHRPVNGTVLAEYLLTFVECG